MRVDVLENQRVAVLSRSCCRDAALWTLLSQLGINPHSGNDIVPAPEPAGVQESVRIQDDAVPEPVAEEQTFVPGPAPERADLQATKPRCVDDVLEDQVRSVFDRFIPQDSKIRREVLLDIVARELGFSRITRDLRHRLNTAISELVRTGNLAVDHNWDNVWRRQK